MSLESKNVIPEFVSSLGQDPETGILILDISFNTKMSTPDNLRDQDDLVYSMLILRAASGVEPGVSYRGDFEDSRGNIL